MSSNRLASAGSAYLRSAAHQPIHWYPWGPEAFAAARAEDKPILLDVGAVWCHWCHVMDRESYDDPSLAEFLNRHFVCVKVDRDERPDVDARYQRAVQLLTGQGGWPLTAFLTPDGLVFYGGTYFPPDGRYGRPGFRSVLASVLEAYRARRDQVQAQASALRRAVDRYLEGAGGGELDAALVDRAIEGMLRAFDPVNGGFGAEPKFPHPAALRLLLTRWWDDPKPEYRLVVERTLQGMARGGIHDQLGGGFHRYSVDARWIVPHFEKMAYDNAELLRIYLDAYAAFGGEEYAETARGIVRWVREVMADPDGGYAGSQDADAGPGDDGDYFTWTRDEAAAVLTPAELEVAAAYYDIGTAGEMHHNPAKNVLFVAAPLPRVALQLGLDPAAARELLESARAKLRAARAARPAPFVDRTRYTNWNAMLASAMLHAGAVLGDEWARAHALATLLRIRSESPEPDRVLHTPGGEPGLLDDQVQAAAAALDAYEATGDRDWLAWGMALLERAWREHRDPAAGGLLDRPAEAPGEGLLAARVKPIEDAPTPSANGVAALACARLHALTGDEAWRGRASEILRAFAGPAAELGLHGATYFLALDRHLNPPTHFVVVGEPGNPIADRMHRAALATFAARRVVQRIGPDEAGRAALPPSLAAMAARSRGPTGYACIGAACSAPAESEEAWREALASRPAAFAAAGGG